MVDKKLQDLVPFPSNYSLVREMGCPSTWVSTHQGRCSESREADGSWDPGCQLELSGSWRGYSRFEQKQECAFVNIWLFLFSLAFFFLLLGPAPPFTLEDSSISAACGLSGSGLSPDKEWYPVRLSRLLPWNLELEPTVPKLGNHRAWFLMIVES